MSAFKDLTGLRFTRLLVLGPAEGQSDQKKWRCRCDCGVERDVLSSNLCAGYSKSCGCLAVDTARRLFRTHGMSGTPEFNCWVGIVRRCNDPKCKSYADYGARGIRVCKRWEKSFSNFYKDMGSRPSAKHTIERIDFTIGYNPSNCVWLLKSLQSRNTRRNRYISYRGSNMLLGDAINLAGNVVKRTTARNRIQSGWSVEDAVETIALPKEKASG